MIELFMDGNITAEQLLWLQDNGIVHGGIPNTEHTHFLLEWIATCNLKNVRNSSEHSIGFVPDFDLLPPILAKGRKRKGEMGGDNNTSFEAVIMRHEKFWNDLIDHSKITQIVKGTYNSEMARHLVEMLECEKSR